MIVTLKSVLELAEARNTAIGAFNVTTLEGIRAVLSVSEELGQPVILQFANIAHNIYVPFEIMGPVLVTLAERASIPVCVHLDHGQNITEVMQALRYGFSSVMYDGSALSYKENVAHTKMVVEAARRFGASVEAEIGAMGAEGSEEGGVADESFYTDPELAQSFVRETGVDALACSFGTVHGLYKAEPKLDFARIAEIREKTGVPIVMHGGSGVSDADYRRCIEQGVRKINFYTYAAKYAAEAVLADIGEKKEGLYYHDIAVTALESMQDTYRKAIRIFAKL